MKTQTYNHADSGAILHEEKGILLIADIARLFSISPNTLRRKKWREKMRIPLRKVGKQLCASRIEIENWFKGIQVNG